MPQGLETRHPEEESEDESGSEEVGTKHTPESSARPGSWRALHYWCWAQGSPVHPEEAAPLRCRSEEELSDSWALSPAQLQENLHF